ncbi:centrosomal protein 20 [Anabrus simplex]|uniref:centrosomal protein 20 n=1 Tax=Anabrus simplex TaxID=316456 RepID=UPI0034DD9CAF
MATEEHFSNVLKETLESNGQLRKIRAKMRAEIFRVLDHSPDDQRPEMTPSVLLVNELVREYLEWLGYHYTNNTFIAESGLPERPTKRSVLMEEIGVTDSNGTASLPLLYSLVSTFKEAMKK